jgi:hypothetical protein
MKYRKKPVVIEAMQLTSGKFWDVYHWIDESGAVDEWDDEPLGIKIKTLEGDVWAREGDWVIRGISDEFYPCKPDIFELTYEVAK